MINRWQNSKNLAGGPLGLLIILLIVVTLRLPSLFEPYWHGDEGITLAVAQELGRHEKLYLEVSDNKPPLLYLIAAKATTLFNFRLLTTIWVVGGIAGFWFLSLNLLSPPAALLATGAATLGLSLPLFEANIVNGEVWFVPLVIWGVFWFTLAQSNPNRPALYFILAGFNLGLATLFKLPASLDAVAMIIYTQTLMAGGRKPDSLGGATGPAAGPSRPALKKLRVRLGLLIFGLTLPWLVTFFWLFFQSHPAGFLRDAIINNVIYTGAWGFDPWFHHSRLIAKGLLLMLVSLIVWNRRQNLTSPTPLILLWLVFSLVGTLLSNRPYRHYAIQLIPALALTIGLTLENKGRLTNRLLALVLGGGTIIFLVNFFSIGFNDLRGQLDYYQHFWRYLQTRDEVEYFDFFDPQVRTLYRAAATISRLTKPEDQLFCWGNNWLLYTLTHRPMASKYPADFVIHDIPNATELTRQQLEFSPPQLIALTEPQRYFLPGLAKMLSQRYDHVAQLNHVSLYQKN